MQRGEQRAGEGEVQCGSCVSTPRRLVCVTVRVVVVVEVEVEVEVVVLNGAARLCALQRGGGQKAAAPPLQ